jgi:hypothetical protein
MVNRILKLNRQDKIQKDIMEEFLAKEEKTCHPIILKEIAKLFRNIDESLNKFKDATLPIFNY